jgi:CDP-paratose 2-epimerase
MWRFFQQPRVAEVYNLGGGKANSCSILEAFEAVSQITGRAQIWSYDERAREGDHQCYYSDLSKAKAHYPGWDITVSLQQTLQEMVEAWQQRLSR